MTLSVGSRLGPYEVLAPIGAGGMGEVYKARDTKLNRDVALKVLPATFAHDPERLARFQREAQVLAALNHPNIAAIHGLEETDGITALVLEFVEGPTIADRIAEGPIPLDEALPIAKQIADALEAAHEQGIIHRDLKPANIKVRPDGTVKVLDFGLAKLTDPSGSASVVQGFSPGEAAPSQAPTLTTPAATRMGVIIGTAAYMSPEQARGKPVDRRSDIWAFGCVLYETLTGRPPFAGETVTDVLGAILHQEPDWDRVPADTPPPVRQLLRRSLTKDARRRAQHIGDVRLEIQDVLEGGGAEYHPAIQRADTSSHRTWRRAAAFAIAGVLVGTLAATGFYWSQREPPRERAASPVRFGVTLPDDGEIGREFSPTVAISPDGRRIVFVGSVGEDRQLYLLDMSSNFEPRPVEGTRGARVPFFSPDGSSIAFVDASLMLRRLSLEGGVSTPIGRVPQLLAGAAWGADDTIVIASASSGLSRVGAGGGALESLTSLDAAAGEAAHFWPSFTPDGRFLIFSVLRRDGFRPARLSLADGTYTVVEGIERGNGARYVVSGHLVWADGADLFAARFDPAVGRLLSDPVRIFSGVFGWAVSGLAYFAVSDEGHLVYVPGEVLQERRRLVLVDTAGRATRLNTEEEYYVDPRFSPDGQRIAVTKGGIVGAGVGDLWVYEVATGRGRPVTSSRVNSWPRWTPDGAHITHYSDYTRVVSTPVREESAFDVLLELETPVFPGDWHPAEPLLLLERLGEQTAADIYVWATGGRLEPVLATASFEGYVDLSPDGRWLAYVSDESGRREVYVKSFPGQERGVPVSRGGGTEPRWSRDGKRLFFWQGSEAASPEPAGTAALMVADVELQPTFRASAPAVLFRGSFVSSPIAYNTLYDVSPIDDRFVMLEPVDQSGMKRLHVVLNWSQELASRLPSPD